MPDIDHAPTQPLCSLAIEADPYREDMHSLLLLLRDKPVADGLELLLDLLVVVVAIPDRRQWLGRTVL
ncbi:MAG TPA: hypothetical protein VG147_02370 [Solirubrobacteraceae bacterium]|nr:hypothetical protein [Solirubrobacteraceae bacterium]